MSRQRVGRIAMIAAMLIVVSSLGAGAAAKTAAVPVSPSVKPSPQCTSTHRVLANDSWTRLAARFRVPQARLLRLNSASLTTPLFIGDTVCLATRATNSSNSSGGGAAGSNTTTTVAPTSSTTTTTTTTTTTVASTPTAPTVTVTEPVACRPIQVSWRGASPDTGLYALQWVRVSAAGTYDFREYTMWNVRGTSTAMPNWLAHGATYALRIYAMRADWDGLTHSNQNVTPHSAIVTFTLPSCNQPAITTTTTTTVAPTPCAQGGTCVVGDIGPGGGTVFYVHPGGGTFDCGPALSSTCRYLEFAPTSGTNAWTDSSYSWSGNLSDAVGATARDTDIGTGYRNTEAIVNQSGGGSHPARAGTVSRGYRGPNNLTDWYLPSQAELNELCKYARSTGQAAGAATVCAGGSDAAARGFTEARYWSSSEGGSDTTWNQDFTDGDRSNGDKSFSRRVRPIRAFGGTTTSCASGGDCAVGDTGPGGGIVFYVHPSGSTFACGSALTSTCRYLEAAPNGWGASTTVDNACDTPGTASIDPSCDWSDIDSTQIGATAQRTAVGTGYANTLAMVGQSATAGFAGTAAWNYSNNSVTDWYLPSQAELNELCKYARSQATGDSSITCNSTGTLRTGFSATLGYWSSTEVDATTARRQRIFSDGSQPTGGKPNDYQVRPVRAFGGATACADGGTCVVGDTGPGGGIVFYVAGANFTSTGSDCGTACRYLEAAPTDQSTGVVWATTAAACYPTGSDSGTSDCQLNSIYSNSSDQPASRTAATGIGAGMANTNQIYARLTTAGSVLTSAYAAGIAWAYTNNGRSDWHLPSKDELNELCKYAKNTGQAAGGATLCSGGADAAVRGFTATNYWSSSEDSAVNAWQHSLFDGSRGANAKFHTTNYVRVVRAFG
ncbi:MAG: DUF1566 domain-containing protein [Ilumatobacteraceae bacterium]